MNPQMHGLTKQFRSSAPFRRGVVQQVTATTATVFDLTTKSTFEASNSTPTGRLPEIGDMWVLSSGLGHWAFDRLLVPASNNKIVSGALSMTAAFNNRNDINWRPFDNPLVAATESPHGAYIGEHRHFQVRPDDRWVYLDGIPISRHRYRALFELLGTTYGAGDGSTTFGIPLAAANATTSRQSLYTAKYSPSADYLYTTSVTAVPGLSHTVTIPAGVNPATYVVRAFISLSVHSDPGVANSAYGIVSPFLDGVQWTPGGMTLNLDIFYPVLPMRTQASTMWEFTFSTTGVHTITARASRTSFSADMVIFQTLSTMVVDEFIQDNGATPGGWYICAE